MIKSGKVVVVIIVISVLVIFWQQYQRITLRDKIFKFYIADPIPETVKLLSGAHRENFSTASLSVSFKTDEETFKSFLNDYVLLTEDEINWVRRRGLYKLPPNVIGYGKWSPDKTVVVTLSWDKSSKTGYLVAMNGSIMQRRSDKEKEEILRKLN